MTPHIDEFLSRARLASAPYTQADIDAAEARVLARCNALDPSSAPAAAAAAEEPTAVEAAQNLRNLCAAVVTDTAALPALRTFLTPRLPEPPGARVLGCILQLAEAEENARFWWQYAAGAGDPAASYCLYLHHRALGEHAPARWWHEQTELLQNTPSTDHLPTRGEASAAEPATVPRAVTNALNDVSTTDASLLPTALRILGALRTGPAPVPATVGAVIDYAPAAVGYVDDFDLPLTDPDFTDHIRTLIATDTTPTRVRNRLQPRPKASRPLIAAARRPPAPHLGMGMTGKTCTAQPATLAPAVGAHPSGEGTSKGPARWRGPFTHIWNYAVVRARLAWSADDPAALRVEVGCLPLDGGDSVRAAEILVLADGPAGLDARVAATVGVPVVRSVRGRRGRGDESSCGDSCQGDRDTTHHERSPSCHGHMPARSL